MIGQPSARPIGHVRRRATTVKRRSAGLTATRAAAGLAMLVAGVAVWGLATSPVFGLDTLKIEGTALTTDAAVTSTLRVADGTNLVTLDTAKLAAALERLPTIASASVEAGLPGTLVVRVTERRPILAWAVGQRRFLVDVDGQVIAEVPSRTPLPVVGADGSVIGPDAAAVGAGTTVAMVDDRRQTGRGIAVGDHLTSVDLDAARRLGSLTPADLGSSATRLTIRANDKDGFLVIGTGGRAAWTAVFGYYTPTLRSPDLIPAQVRLLRSLLATGEAGIGRVTLATATDGTYVPAPSPSVRPSAAPSGSATP